MIPDSTRASELIAPSVSPISIAFDVPIAWDAVPIASPFATGSVILNTLQTPSAQTFPSIPVITIAAAVNDGKPPSSSEMTIPIAVVTDFGSSVTKICLSSPKSRESRNMVRIPENVPAPTPIRTAAIFLFRCSSFS